MGFGVTSNLRAGVARSAFLLALFLSFSLLGDDGKGDKFPGAVVLPGQVDCVAEVIGVGKPLNEPDKLPPYAWVRLHNIGEVAARAGEAINFYVDTRDLPITPENLLKVYRLGGKLYQHFDRIDPETKEVETHRWEFPAFRGVNRMASLKKALAETTLVAKMQKLFYPHRLPHPTKKTEKVLDLGRPGYEFRINFDTDVVIEALGKAERLASNTSTKQKIVDVNNHTVKTTLTWLSKDVLDVFKAMVKSGHAYTVGVYTTAQHPQEIKAGTQGGKLVAGALGIAVDGVYTGISLFMDRSHEEGKPNALFYDGAGRLGFFAELDLLEGLGVQWVDSVTVNQAARDFGGNFVSRLQFHALLEAQHKRLDAPAPLSEGTWAIRFDRWDKEKLKAELALPK